jgi:hypothetical protein
MGAVVALFIDSSKLYRWCVIPRFKRCAMHTCNPKPRDWIDPIIIRTSYYVLQFNYIMTLDMSHVLWIANIRNAWT